MSQFVSLPTLISGYGVSAAEWQGRGTEAIINPMNDQFYVQMILTDISVLRNRIVQDYGNVDLNVVCMTLTKDNPALGEMMGKVRFQ